MVRRLLIVGLSLVILARTIHCLYVDAGLCAGKISDSAPITNPEESDPNETGCICKGAVFAPPVLVADAEWQCQLISPDQLLLAAPLAVLPTPADWNLPEPYWPAPCSPGQMRALLAIWQI